MVNNKKARNYPIVKAEVPEKVKQDFKAKCRHAGKSEAHIINSLIRKVNSGEIKI